MSFAVLLLAACAKVDMPDIIEQSYDRYPVSLNVGPAPESKITLDGLSVAWEMEDKLEITAMTEDTVAISELSVYSIDAADNRKASFTGFVTMLEEPKSCVFTYPSGNTSEVDTTGLIKMYYSNQTGRHMPFLYASCDYDPNGMSAVMEHVGAVLAITVSDDIRNAGVTTIGFCGNSLESLSPALIDPADGKVTFPNKDGVQINVPLQESGPTYIAVPPVNMTKGFSIICSYGEDEDKKSMFRTFSSDGGMTSGYDFSARRGQIIPIEIKGGFEHFGMTCGTPEVVHETKDGLYTGTSVSFQMTKKGASTKFFEKWGAKLFKMNDKDTVLFRSVEFSNTDEKLGEKVSMDVRNDWKLIPEGTYIFAPYFVAFGQKISLATKMVEVGPSAKITLSGITSYSYYTDNDSSTDPNLVPNNKIQNVVASINVHPDIIDSFTATVQGDGTSANPDEKKEFSASSPSSSLYFGHLTRNKWISYEMTGSAKVGSWELPVEKTVFHITGLPYHADFKTLNPNSNPAWGLIGAGYSDNRVTFNSSGKSALRSPAFHIPDNSINVKTSCSIRYNITKRWSEIPFELYLEVCSKDKNNADWGENAKILTISTNYYQRVTGSGSFDEKGYVASSDTFVLNSDTPCMIYSCNINNSYIFGNLAVSFGHKIEYK